MYLRNWLRHSRERSVQSLPSFPQHNSFWSSNLALSRKFCILLYCEETPSSASWRLYWYIPEGWDWRVNYWRVATNNQFWTSFCESDTDHQYVPAGQRDSVCRRACSWPPWSQWSTGAADTLQIARRGALDKSRLHVRRIGTVRGCAEGISYLLPVPADQTESR